MGAAGDIVIVMTDQERGTPAYEGEDLRRWRAQALRGRRWFADHGVSFGRHYTGSLACVPSRPTMFTGHYPGVHGVTQTDGLGKAADDSRMRWLRPGSVPTLGHWLRAAGYDSVYFGKWHITDADLHDEDGHVLQTNTDDGAEVPEHVQRYLTADPLDELGFSGWIGPEPHGPLLANAGVRRDPWTADRAVAWLTDRYRRRRAGDEEAMRPFLLVASFVNPHDIVFFPAWADDDPLASIADPPPVVPASPTDDEDLLTKPRAQRAYRDCYPSAYGPADVVRARYVDGADRYRWLYYRLHQEVDDPIDRVRRAVTDEHAATGGDVLLVRTADHGELLGAHGGLHQKWFNLYDEAARVPFEMVRLGPRSTRAALIDTAPTSHVDLVPTLIAQAGAVADELAPKLRADFQIVGSFPGRDLSPLLDDPGSANDDAFASRPVYLMTRDNILEGDSGASLLARRLARAEDPPPELRIQTPTGVGTCFEAVVVRIDAHPERRHRTASSTASPTTGLWKLVRTSASADGVGGDPLGDEWELYDLDTDPIEATNRADDPAAKAVLELLQGYLAEAAVGT